MGSGFNYINADAACVDSDIKAVKPFSFSTRI